MILKVVKSGSSEVEYYEGESIIKQAVVTVGEGKEPDVMRAIVSNSHGLVADIGIKKGDVSYVMENGKTVDCFQA